MKIYFTCSTAEFLKYKDYYFNIRQHIISLGHTLTRDWMPHTLDRLNSGQYEIKDIKEIYKSCILAIREADIVIIEDTVSNFSTGHQITMSLMQNKPTLVLWQGNKYRQFKQMFIHGIDSDLLKVVEYPKEKSSFKDIIKTFIAEYENIHEKHRFHLVLSDLERQYLDWAQLSKRSSRTSIIRRALRNTINDDIDYQKYLLQR